MLDGSEVPEPPEVKSAVWGRRIWEGKVSGSGMRREEGGGAHCGVRSKRKEVTCLRTYLGLRRLHSAVDAEG